jgi:hypothetical protein
LVRWEFVKHALGLCRGPNLYLSVGSVSEGGFDRPSDFGEVSSGFGEVPPGLGEVASGSGEVPSGLREVASGSGGVSSGFGKAPPGFGGVASGETTSGEDTWEGVFAPSINVDLCCCTLSWPTKNATRNKNKKRKTELTKSDKSAARETSYAFRHWVPLGN